MRITIGLSNWLQNLTFGPGFEGFDKKFQRLEILKICRRQQSWDMDIVQIEIPENCKIHQWLIANLSIFYCMHHQWAENFICDEVAGEELWEEVVAAARMLANSTEAEVYIKDLNKESSSSAKD